MWPVLAVACSAAFAPGVAGGVQPRVPASAYQQAQRAPAVQAQVPIDHEVPLGEGTPSPTQPLAALALLASGAAFGLAGVAKLTRSRMPRELEIPVLDTEMGLARAGAPVMSATLDPATVTPAAVTKSIKTPDPIPDAAIQPVTELMKSGRLYRYNADSAETSEVAKVESELAAYTGHKYCVSLNSCGSGIFLMLKCVGVQPGDKVLTNVFTFAAVPSAIVHANAEPVYVNGTSGFILDLADLELKAKESGAKYLVVSHMRGKVSDMDQVKEICDRHNITLVEDCAHSLAVHWNGKHTGHHGVACAFSAQSYKMLNSGEGGFLMTNDDEIAAKAMCYAGSYEKLYVKHSSCPPHEVMEKVRHETPNFSMRMHEVTAAMLRPQIPTLDERREKYNERYYRIEKKLVSGLPEHISVESQLPQVTICGDSIQFSVSGVSETELEVFQDLCKDRGVITEVFGAASNCRNFKNWHFAPLPGPDCEPTHEIIKYAVDLRLPLLFTDGEIDLMADIVLESMEAVLAARGNAAEISGHVRATAPVMTAASEPLSMEDQLQRQIGARHKLVRSHAAPA